jgi:hypothetical protein
MTLGRDNETWNIEDFVSFSDKQLWKVVPDEIRTTSIARPQTSIGQTATINLSFPKIRKFQFFRPDAFEEVVFDKLCWKEADMFF